MIAFGCPITKPEEYERWAGPSIQRCAEPDSLVIEQRGHGSIQNGLNAILDKVAARQDLEALILLHQDVELNDSNVVAVRRAFSDPTVGILGAAGSTLVRGVDWWEAKGYGQLRNPRLGGSFGWDWNATHGAHDVDTVDGCLMVLAPWVACTVRLPVPADGAFHGYDLDLCLRVRARGGRVMVDDLDPAHYISATFRDRDAWVSAAMRTRRSWDRELWPREWKAEW